MTPPLVRMQYLVSEMNNYYAKLLLLTLFVLYNAGCQDSPLKKVMNFPSENENTGGHYPTINGIYAELNRLQMAQIQNLELFQVGELTKNEHPIPLVRISSLNMNNPKHYLFVAGTHGDEAIVVKSMLYAIKKISYEIEKQPQDGKSYILDFIPLHNPDGYAENERTNAAGIDLNRNFPYASAYNVYEPETNALVRLINTETYDISLYFHSANESKYNNVIRCPMEYRKKGPSVLKQSKATELNTLIDIIIEAVSGIEPENVWSVRSDLVDAGGIASDWCVSDFIINGEDKLVQESCKNPHPSLTLEMTFPKQPLDQSVIKREKGEMLRILNHLIERL